MHPARIVAILSLCGLLSGCAAVFNFVADSSIPVVRGQADSFEARSDLDAAEREAPGNLELLTPLLENAPNSAALNAVGAQLVGGLAFAFVEPLVGPYDIPDPARVAKAKALYIKGREYGQRALRQKPAFRENENGDVEAFTKALEDFGALDVPALFWTAYNWGQLINLSKDDPELVVELPRVTALMGRVKQLDAPYYHGGAHAFDMVNAAARPGILGGQPEVAKAAYERAIAVDGGKFLTHHLMFAQYYAVQIQDPKLFKRTLEDIISAPADILPKARLANDLARRRAKLLLAKISDFFPDLEEDATNSHSPTIRRFS